MTCLERAEPRREQVFTYLEQLRGARHQFVVGNVHVAVLDAGLERVQEAGLESLGRVAGDAELAGDRIGGAKPDAPDLVREAVRILAHHADRVLAVLLDDARGERTRDADAEQEHHHVLDVALRREHLRDRRRTCTADADDLGEPRRRALDDVERLDPELLDDPLRERRPDSGERLRAEKLLDPGGGLRRDQLVFADLTLLAPLAIDDPRAVELDRHALVDPDELADDRDLTVATRELRDGECRVVVAKRDPLDGAVEHDLGVTRHARSIADLDVSLQSRAVAPTAGMIDVASTECGRPPMSIEACGFRSCSMPSSTISAK